MTHALGCEIPVRHRNSLRGSIGVILFVLATTASAGNDGLPWPLGTSYPIHGFVPNLPSWAGSNLHAQARTSWDGYGTDRYEPSGRDDGVSPSDKDPEPRREHLCDNPVDVVTGMKFEFTTDYGENGPVLLPGVATNFTVAVRNTSEKDFVGGISLSTPAGWQVVARVQRPSDEKSAGKA